MSVPNRPERQLLPANMLELIDEAFRRRAGQPTCAPDNLGIRDQRYARRPLDGY
jgi:hypothetical protein